MVSSIVVDALSSLFLCAVVFLVLSGNTLVVLAVATSRKLRTVTNVFIVNLACADLFLGVFILPFSAVLEIKDIWIFGHIWCQVWLAVDVWLCTASILTLCCISLDRYLAITWPIRYPGLMSSRRAKTLVAGVWLISFVIGCPPLIGWNDFSFDNVESNVTTTAATVTIATEVSTHNSNLLCGSFMNFSFAVSVNTSCMKNSDTTLITSCELTNSRGYRIYAALGSFFIPMLVMVFFYLQIYRAAVRTIAAYEKGELKTKYSIRESANGLKTSSVTLRVHRGGRGFGAGGISGNAQGSIRGRAGTSPSPREIAVGKDVVGRRFDSQTSIRRTRSSDASLVKLAELAYEALDNENAHRAPSSDALQRRCKSLCWKTEKTCLECTNQRVARESDQNGRDLRSKLFELRCVSVESEESSSGDTKFGIKRSNGHKNRSPHNFTQLTQSASCQTLESGAVFFRGTSTTDKQRRSRFSTQKSASAMKLHMQKFNREKKAAKTLAIIVGAFILCWMPFFTTYLVGAFCDNCISPLIFSVVFWLGYCNSAVNPCVYALFSKDFRFAFTKLVTCKYRGWYTSRNCLPHTYDVPAIQLQCAPQEDARSSSDLEGQWR